MKANVGSYDSAVRFIAGCVMLIAANRGHGSGLAGFAVVASAAGFCPVYWLLGIETGRAERADRRELRVGRSLRRTRILPHLAAPPRRRRRFERRALD